MRLPACFLLAVLATGARAQAPADPYVRSSASGRWTAFVEPSDPQGRGSSELALVHERERVSDRTLPFTPRDLVVGDTGALLALTSAGRVLLAEGAREFVDCGRPAGEEPARELLGLLDLSWSGCAIVRARRATGAGEEVWWRFDLERGRWLDVVRPESELGAWNSGFLHTRIEASAGLVLVVERGTKDTSWLRALDADGCTQGLDLLGGMGFDPLRLRADGTPVCGNWLRSYVPALVELRSARAFGVEHLAEWRTQLLEAREPECPWPHVQLPRIGTLEHASLAVAEHDEVTALPMRGLDGRWLGAIAASARLATGGHALVALPVEELGERAARLVLTDAAGGVVDEHVLPFADALEVVADARWVAVVPRGRASVALLELATSVRREVLTRTFGRAARAVLRPGGRLEGRRPRARVPRALRAAGSLTGKRRAAPRPGATPARAVAARSAHAADRAVPPAGELSAAALSAARWASSRTPGT